MENTDNKPRATTVIRKGIETKRVTAKEIDECDLCGLKGADIEGKTAWLWDALDVPEVEPWMLTEVAGIGTTMFLCDACDSEMMANVKYQYKGGGEGTNTGYQGWSNTAWDKNKKKSCLEPHWFKILHPTNDAHLRLTSERGGLWIDDTTDYALFFSTGWERITSDVVATYQPGHKPPPPKLDAIDKSNWPGVVFVDWHDYGAPDDVAVMYARWVAQQWNEGRSVQFGCFGGHGRTGTFAALVLIEARGYTGEQAFDWVRKEYCFDAIEGKSQEDFIKGWSQGKKLEGED